MADGALKSVIQPKQQNAKGTKKDAEASSAQSHNSDVALGNSIDVMNRQLEQDDDSVR